jgi:L-amino acid N-acyltransferase
MVFNSPDAMIRPATQADMASVCDLYNALIPTTTVTWTNSLQTLDERLDWFDSQTQMSLPVFVAESADGSVIGFTSYGSFRGDGKKPGYRFTVEHTIHIAQDQWGSGVGRALLLALIERARTDGLHVMVGAIDAENEASLRFHERLGFTEVARMPQVGRKFDRWLDLVLVQLILGDEP